MTVKSSISEEADVGALRAILSERLAGPFVSAEEMRARTETLIAPQAPRWSGLSSPRTRSAISR